MNSELQLIHDLTPPSLTENCQAISETLSAEELDSQRLMELVEERDKLIQEHLPSLQNEEKNAYINKELEVNKQLLERAHKLQTEQKKLLLGLVRGKSAVSQYR